MMSDKLTDVAVELVQPHQTSKTPMRAMQPIELSA